MMTNDELPTSGPARHMLWVVCLAMGLASGAFAIVAQDGATQPKTLTAAKVEKIDFKAELTEGWSKAATVETPTFAKPGTPGPDVELRAMHDGENIYVMARWKDDAKSDTKSAWEYKEGAWSKQRGDEDRIAFAFDINAEGFAEKGCMALCHDGSMGTKAEDQYADLWHWKAARGGQNGHCDDQQFAGGEIGRPDDAGKSAYEANASADGKSPKWIWKEGAEKSVFDNANTRELPADLKPDNGYTVPSVRQRDPDGSRGDVTCVSQWADGWWTVVLKRKLDTGNKDDAKFTAGATNNFALAVLNNTGVKTGTEHAKSPVIKLSIE